MESLDKKNLMGNFPICNKKPSTAPCIRGKSFILCWRCTMVMMSTLSFSILFEIGLLKFMRGQKYIILGLVFIVLMFWDGYMNYFTKYKSNNFRRIITGALFGLGISIILYNMIKVV